MTKTERTQKVIDEFRGLNQEWYMLKGIVCIPDGVLGGDTCDVFDFGMIGRRMDEIDSEEYFEEITNFDRLI
jgi:hypothetical protein